MPSCCGSFPLMRNWTHSSSRRYTFADFFRSLLSVRNMAGVAKDVFRWREETASGKMLGPRIVAAGPLLDGPNPAHPEHAIPVHNAAEARLAVRSVKSMGSDFIKVYDGVP